MIVNFINKPKPHEFLCLWTSGHQKKHVKNYNPWFPQNWMDHLDVGDRRIFYVEFMGIDTFKIYKLEDYVDPEFIDEIRNGELALYIHQTGHGYHECAEEIYLNVVFRDKVPIKNLIVSSESLDFHNAVLWAANKYNVEPYRTRIGFEFEGYGKLHIEQDERVKPTSLPYKQYDKKFVSLNGYYRDHRAAIIFLLASYNLLDKGYVSFNIKYGGVEGSETLKNLMDRMGHVPEIVELFHNNRDKLKKINSILLDTEYDQQGRNLAQPEVQHIEFFHNTYFTILTETNFPEMRRQNYVHNSEHLYDYIGRLYSEKTFRCITFKHPFLATGPMHFLKGLHWLGYKTFHPIIDESYDNEPDGAKRLLMIAKEAKRLCELEGEELRLWLAAARKICQYNFEVLSNKKVFAYDLPLNPKV